MRHQRTRQRRASQTRPHGARRRAFLPALQQSHLYGGPRVRARRRALRHSRRVVGLPVPASAYPSPGRHGGHPSRKWVVSRTAPREHHHHLPQSRGIFAYAERGIARYGPRRMHLGGEQSRANPVARIADLPRQTFRRRLPHPFQFVPRGGKAARAAEASGRGRQSFHRIDRKSPPVSVRSDALEAKTRAATERQYPPHSSRRTPRSRKSCGGWERRRRGRCRY